MDALAESVERGDFLPPYMLWRMTGRATSPSWPSASMRARCRGAEYPDFSRLLEALYQRRAKASAFGSTPGS